jgi:YVTN family beta-propeller protein
VTPIQTATGTAGQPIKVGESPVFIAITPDGKTAYVANYYSDALTQVRIATGTAGKPIKTGKNPAGMAIRP